TYKYLSACKQLITKGAIIMLNIFFSLFLLGMLVVLCGKAIRRAMHQQQPLNSKEAALLIALSLGCLFALNAGVSAVYKTQLLFY
ncbi:hypothetical protein, partial [Phascolarctobacterium succinatutens]